MATKKVNNKIYLVDDDKSFGEAMVRSLTAKGYSVEHFTNPLDSLNKFKISAPDLAIIDCMLPKKNGLDLAAEIRADGHDTMPIILVSGVFKDKSYSDKAIGKTNAAAFLAKPFELDELYSAIENALPDEVVTKENPISNILAGGNMSQKKLLRQISKISEANGFEIPLLINLLLDSGTSGSLNISMPNNSIVGVQIAEGKIISVDTEHTNEISKKILIRNNDVDEADLNSNAELLERGNLLMNLVNECYISPHIVGKVKSEQIFKELKDVFKDATYGLSFSESTGHKYETFLEPSMIAPFFEDILTNETSLKWLKSYYSMWGTAQVQYGPNYSAKHPILLADLIKKAEDWLDNIDDGPSLEELLEQGSLSEVDKFKALHLLVSYRCIIFEQASTVMRQHGDLSRLESLYEILSTKNPIEIFKYFGSSGVAGQAEVDRIYKELAKIYHPDKLSKSATEQHKKLADEIFRILANAHGTLTNSEKREAFEDQVKQKDAEKQLKAEAILDDGVKELRRGRVSEAVILLEIAAELHPNQTARIYACWAKLKQAEQNETKDENLYADVKGALDLVPAEERSNTEYHHTLGLYYKAIDKPILARNNFEKALKVDGGFIEARRELSSLGESQNSKQSTTITDLFNQDLSVVVSNLFKKKTS